MDFDLQDGAQNLSKSQKKDWMMRFVSEEAPKMALRPHFGRFLLYFGRFLNTLFRILA